MHEYEFRLVVQNSSSLDYILNHIASEWLGSVVTRPVYYIKPHFRFRDRALEIKTILNTKMVYHDRLWFRWIHSKEIPYEEWNMENHKTFLDAVGNFQCPFRIEKRRVLKLDDCAQIYTFQAIDGMFRLVFEWEYGVFKKSLESIPGEQLLSCLTKYQKIYNYLRGFPHPTYTLDEHMSRKPVTCIPDLIYSDTHLVAHKWDGTFGMVYSYSDRIVEKWEGGLQKLRKGITIDDGIVFSAENLGHTIILLDVYQVRGHLVAPWCKRNIFLEYLPSISLPKGYRAQKYYFSAFQLPEPDFNTDGYIIHDTESDNVFKVKENHSLDVMYNDGYFYIPQHRFKSLEEDALINGHIYEVSISDGRVLRERTDRMTGNTQDQIHSILNKRKWGGSTIEKIIPPVEKSRPGRKKLSLFK